jgi:hypothetical protein
MMMMTCWIFIDSAGAAATAGGGAHATAARKGKEKEAVLF